MSAPGSCGHGGVDVGLQRGVRAVHALERVGRERDVLAQPGHAVRGVEVDVGAGVQDDGHGERATLAGRPASASSTTTTVRAPTLPRRRSSAVVDPGEVGDVS